MMQNKIDDYIRYLALRNHDVISTESTVWINIRPGIYQVAPPFRYGPKDVMEIHDVFQKRKLNIAARFFSEANNSECLSDVGLYVAKPPYDLSGLQQKARNQTRRGLERVVVEKMDLNSSIEEQAYTVYFDNIRRLGVFRTEEQIRNKWETWVRAIRGSKCSEFWCALANKKIVGFTLIVWTPWGVEIGMQRLLYSESKLYPNNALIYTVANSVFERGAPFLSFGLSHYGNGKQGLDHFKKNMNFQLIPLKEHYVWNPMIRPLISWISPRVFHNIYNFKKLLGHKN